MERGKKILAIVVTYYPEKELLVRNVQAFIGHVDKVLIWENTPSPDKLDYRFISHEKVEYFGDGVNSISRALNFAWEYANEKGFDYMLTMDQDSYFENFDFYVGRTVFCKDAPDGIWTPQMNREAVSDEYEEIDIPITSGMLASVKIVNAIGGWNESYTIASVDDEFFLQAHQCKIKKYKVKDASLLQRFGITQVVTVFGHKLELRNYGPQRLYDIYRNNIILIRKYPKIDYLRKNFFHYWLKAIVLVFLFEKQRFKKTAAIFKGIISGLRYKNEELRNLGIASLKKDTNVLVLMSTYNGEAYLRKQLDSILHQDKVKVHLMVRDDGSTDHTCDILAEYGKKYPNMEWQTSENVGFVRSFSILAEKALSFPGTIDYYAFSDQDDIWMPNKLKTACRYLEEAQTSIEEAVQTTIGEAVQATPTPPNLGGETTPLLFSSNSLFVDDNMSVLGTFHREMPHYTKQNVMIYPTEQGCSMVFNRSALELYDANPPKNAWHDRWMCLICNFLGKSVYCQSPLFYYRIHGGNMIGKKQNFWDRIMDDIKFFFTSDAKNSQMVEEFYQAYESRLSEGDRDILNVFLHYKDSFKNKWKIVMSPEYQRASNWQERMRKAVLLLFNKI